MTREEIIEAITNDDIIKIMDDSTFGDYSYLNDLLRMGMKGYDNFTDKKLIEEYNERGFFRKITKIDEVNNRDLAVEIKDIENDLESADSTE